MFFADIYSTFNSSAMLICAHMHPCVFKYNLVRSYDFWGCDVVKLEDIFVPNKRSLQSKYSPRGSFTTWAGGKGPAGNAAKGRK